jgi:hypothetical protein
LQLQGSGRSATPCKERTIGEMRPGSCASDLGNLLMMKISVVESRSRLWIVVEGKLVAPWSAELRRALDSARPQLRGRTLVIDLRNATHISREGENALLDLMTERPGSRLSRSGGAIDLSPGIRWSCL